MTTDANRAPAGGSGRAYVLLTFTTLCWGANAIFGRLAVGELSPMMLVSLRWLGASLLLAMFAHNNLRRDWPVLRPRLAFLSAMGVSMRCSTWRPITPPPSISASSRDRCRCSF